MLHRALKGHLVGVDKVGPLLGDGPGHIPQGRRVQDVVVVQKGDVFALCQRKAGVGVAGYPLVFVQLLVADAGLVGHPGGHRPAHLLVLAGVYQAELPVPVGLVDHRIQQLGQKVEGGVVEGHHNADEGPRRLVLCLADQQVHRGQPVGPEGPAREVCVEIGPVGPAAADAGQTFPPQLPQQNQQRQGGQHRPRLAEQVAQGPGGLPAMGLGDAVKGGLQLPLVLMGGRQLAALMIGQLLIVAAALLGPVQLEAQRVEGGLIPFHKAVVRPVLGRTEEGRAAQRAPALPAKIAAQAGRVQRPGPGRQHRGRLRLPRREEDPLPRQGLRAGGVLPLHHDQVIGAGPAGGQLPPGREPGLLRGRGAFGAQAPGVDLAVPQGLRQTAVPHHQHLARPELGLDQAGKLPLPPGPFLQLPIICALHILAPILYVQPS